VKITTDKTILLSALSKVQAITGKKTSLHATENVLITANDTAIDISATNLETGFMGQYPATVDRTGSISISSKKLFEILKAFPGDEISINETKVGQIEINNATTKYKIICGSTDDFPDMPDIDEMEFIEVSTVCFQSMLEMSVMIASTGDENRPHITGILFEFENGHAKSCSTDGKRLSTDMCKFGGADISKKIIMPKSSARDVLKFISGNHTNIGISDNQVVLQSENETMVIILMEGDFPDSSSITKTAGHNVIEFNVTDLKAMLKRMSILISEDYKGAIFNLSKNNLTITTQNPQYGESKEHIDIEYSADDVEICFNPVFFIDALNLMPDGIVNVHIKDAESPCILISEHSTTAINAIMPMRK
jgi:DNA polymerase-3 subunit beta